MKISKGSIFFVPVSVVAGIVFWACSAWAGPLLSTAVANYDIIILTPGHSRTIFYELHNSVVQDVTAVQGTLILTAGAGTLNIGVANSSFIGEGAEIVFFTSGFVGTTPVIDYAYSSAPISASVDVAEVSAGFLITGVLFDVGDPDYPVTMSMTFSLY